MPIPKEAGSVNIIFLPPVSGLAATETRLDYGAINVGIGEGRTADVLRDLCYCILEESPERWNSLVDRIETLFGAKLEAPRYVEERGEITMGYQERDKPLDLSSSGRGLQQTLLVVACMYANPDAAILLDEPDAHLEILRQRQIYNLITEVASEQGNQIIADSHAEVLLNEAAGRDLVVAFVGRPHRIGGGKSQVRKALTEIGFEQYYQAEQTGWVLYLEGSTDLRILQAVAKRLGNDCARAVLERPFVHYVGNSPAAAAHHFHGLREAPTGLKGVALFDRLASGAPDDPYLRHLVWERREIENYLCTERTLTSLCTCIRAGSAAHAAICAGRGQTPFRSDARGCLRSRDRLEDLRQGIALGCGAEGKRRIPNSAIRGLLSEDRNAQSEGEKEFL